MDFAQLDNTCLDSHHDFAHLNIAQLHPHHDDSIRPTNQSQDCLSPIAHNGTSGLFQSDDGSSDEPSFSFIDQDEKLLPTPPLSLSQMISKTPQPQFCSTPKQPKSLTPTVQGEIKKRRILSLATSRLSSRVTPLKSIQTPSLKSSETPRVAPLKTPRVTPLKSIQTPRVKSIKTPSLKTTPPLKSSEAPRVKSIQTPRGAPLKLIKTPRITPSFKPTHQNVTQRMFNRRQAKIPQAVIERSRKNVIDVDTCTPKATKILYWIPELRLTVYDREVLLNPLGWLTDNLINAAQQLLKRAFPAVPGLQDVIKGIVFSYEVESGEFVQVVNNHHGHWLTVSTIGTLHPVGMTSTGVKAQIATLLHTEAKEITLNLMNVHIQAGGCDCGLFAIANATALAFGHSPGSFQYNQHKMRQHLFSCFQKQQILHFPIKKYRRAPDSIVSIDTYPVYCLCRMPEMATMENWVECSTCKEWYHYDTCVNVPAAFLKKSAVWHCMQCSAKPVLN